MGKAIFYIDGMNMYHGVRKKYGREFLWLDLYALAQQLRRDDDIHAVRYFTTIVAGEPDAAMRQETYLAALTAYRPQVEVIRGRYKKKKFRCHVCRGRWTCECDPVRTFHTYEEKLTDVALAVSMVRDAAEGYGDLSILISTDSDLIPAIAATAELAPERPIYVACPPGRHPRSHDLPENVTTFLISKSHLGSSLLPDEIQGAKRIYHRPEKWQ